ncbi:hypothetical protein LTR62_000681 [Meristemomyces frigidus]|uniref:Cell division control protein 73 C-terminal domain-containing protein n=1 Tax=Meristemomyces frigidus TaxID=1508187 RepID=A0AAN7YLF0_9PEZI|nr:hypothetical protein LTR62_000681 [Meristemomyces frigidus]
MATSNPSAPPDSLGLLRQCIASHRLPIPAIDEDPSTATDTTLSLAVATHLIFNLESAQDGAQHISIPLSQPTRFVSVAAGDRQLDLRSVFFCWQNRDQSASNYIAVTQALNDELRSKGTEDVVTNLIFAEKLDLNQWLAGEVGEEESEYIRSLDANKATRAEAKDAAITAAGGEDVEMRDAGLADGAAAKREQERLREIFAAERKMGDRNLMLRGAKIQDYSGIRKQCSALFFGKSRGPASGAQPVQALTHNSNPALRPPPPSVKPAPSGRRPEPIILLSPSASSLLRMPNIKSFLGEGVYVPPESGTASNILHLTRLLPGHSKPIRFVLVDDPSTFRPDYWDRLVAVFTTGQTWQFKNYKWQFPADLFAHALGVYVGWKGELVPETVKGWGRGVMVAQIDKGRDRWRDREVVEEVWRGIEGRMKEMGWGREGR